MAQRSPPAEESLVEFRWEVPADGFEVTKPVYVNLSRVDRKRVGRENLEEQLASEIRGEPFLTARTPAGPEYPAHRYNPLVYNPIAKEDPEIHDHRPRLFRNFCDLEPTGENILKFANTCGMLVGDNFVVPEGRKEVFAGEPLSLWRHEVADMRLAFGLWNALLERDVAFLKEHIHFTKVDGGFVVDCRRGTPRGGKGTSFATFKIVDTRSERNGRASFLMHGEYRLAAVFAVQDLIRKRLQEHVGASVLYAPERDHLAGKSWAMGATQARHLRLPLGLRMVPQNLLGALWLQLAQEIEQGTEYRRCKMCPRRIEISLEGYRKNRTTCSDKCRRALQRKREDDARTMRVEGRSFREIAEALGTTVACVRAWTAKPKRPRGRPRTSGRGRQLPS